MCGTPFISQFERQRDEALDFFGSMIGPLRDEFDLRRREIGIGVHWHSLKRENAADGNEAGQHQDQKLLSQSRLDDSMNHSEMTEPIL